MPSIFDTINASITSGTQLAALLDAFRDIVVSGFKGTSRPVNILPGGYWIDTTLQGSPNFLWVMNLYDGSDDIELMTININTNTVYIDSLATGEFEIIQISDDAVGAQLILRKKRIAGSAQVLNNDVIGLMNFKSTDQTGAVISEAASIEASATQNHTNAAQGSRIKINVKKTGQTSRTTQVTIGDTITVAPATTFSGLVTLSAGADGTPLRGAVVQGTDLAAPGTVGSSTVTTQMAGKTDSSGSTVKGVVVVAPYNKVILRVASGVAEDDKLYDVAGNEVYGRMTKAGAVWTLTYYTKISSTETAHTLTASQSSAGVRWYYQELFNPLLDMPVYNELFVTPSDNATTDIIDASATQPGKVSIAAQTFAGEKTFENALVPKVVATPATPPSGYYKLYPKADGFYALNDAGAETKIGTGSSGGVNYAASNPDAEVNTAGWTTFADAAASRPVDGVGGSPNSTWTRTTSSPLNGTGSFLWTKSGAASRQGEGVAFDFDIPLEFRGKPHTYSLAQILGSGTFAAGSTSADSDLIVYFYDRTNTKLVEPTSIRFFSNSTTVSEILRGQVQFDLSCTQARIMIYTATTSASNYTVKFDDFYIGPSTVSFSSVITDPTAFTPTLAGFGTVSSNTAIQWREGRFLCVQGRIVLSAATTTTMTVAVPAGLSIDLTANGLLAAEQNLTIGDWDYIDASDSGRIFAGIPIAGYADSPLKMRYNSATDFTFGASVFQANATSPVTWATGDTIHYRYKVPIVGWSSSLQVSDQTDNRVCNFTGTSTAGTSTAISTTTNIPFTAVEDSHGAWNGTQYVVKVAGKYNLSCNIAFASATWGQGHYNIIYLYKNNAVYKSVPMYIQYTGTQIPSPMQISAQSIPCNVGDTLEIRVIQNEGTRLLGTTAEENTLSISRQGGPSQIAAIESMNARYTNVASTSITNSGADIKVPFATKDFDTHGSFVTDTYTCQVSGKFEVIANLNFTTQTYAVGNVVAVTIYKNGAVHTVGPILTVQAATSQYVGCEVAGLLSCVAGDTIDIRVANNRTAGATTLSSTAGQNSVTFKRVGF